MNFKIALNAFILSLAFMLSCSKAKDKFAFGPTIDPKKENHLQLGNPSKAGNELKDSLNFLLDKPQFSLSYNSSKGTPNWVAWHLNKTWIGEADRQNNFRADNSLPISMYKVRESDYTNSGFDRGHMCPSADRTLSEDDNSSTFLMTNIIPQAPNLNRFAWKNFEEYSRSLVDRGFELYIFSGRLGEGGIGSHDSTTYRIGNSKVSVPAFCWKVALILKEGDNDLSRIDSNTIIIAALMPNINSKDLDWVDFITTTNNIEVLTGYDFFNLVPKNIQEYIESKKTAPF